MSTSRKPNSYKPGTSQEPLARGGGRVAGTDIAPMTFDERLCMYTIRQKTPKASRRPDGLTPRQYKRLVKKDRHAFAQA